MQGCARLEESGLGTELTWDARQSTSLEAKVLVGLRPFRQENKDQIKEDPSFKLLNHN